MWRGRTITTIFCAALYSGAFSGQAEAYVDCAKWNTEVFFKEAITSDITRCLENGEDIHARNEGGDTPLHMAAHFGTAGTITALLEAGAEIEARIPTDIAYGYTYRNGATPLHFAAGYNTADAVNALVKAGAEIEALNARGMTPLHFSADNGNDATTNALLDANANIEAWSDGERTPLHFAGQNGNAATIYTLISRNAEIEARDNQNHTPLHIAAYHGTPETVKALVYAGADFMSKDNAGWTPLHFVARNFNGLFNIADSINILLNAGADPHARAESNGWTPFHVAAMAGTPATVKAFINAGVPADQRDNAHRYPYHYAEENWMLKGNDVLPRLLRYTKTGR